MFDEMLALESVRIHVWSGFYETDDIVEIIDESLFEPGEVDIDWLRARVGEEFQRKREAELRWEQITDCDRIDQAFETLNKQGIVALQNAGYTLSDGLDDVIQRYHERGAEGSDIVGYCYYHGQDVEHVLVDGTLYLAFGDIGGDNVKGVEIGRAIVNVLRNHGFEVEWPESCEVRIRLSGITWQRREIRI